MLPWSGGGKVPMPLSKVRVKEPQAGERTHGGCKAEAQPRPGSPTLIAPPGPAASEWHAEPRPCYHYRKQVGDEGQFPSSGRPCRPVKCEVGTGSARLSSEGISSCLPGSLLAYVDTEDRVSFPPSQAPATTVPRGTGIWVWGHGNRHTGPYSMSDCWLSGSYSPLPSAPYRPQRHPVAFVSWGRGTLQKAKPLYQPPAPGTYLSRRFSTALKWAHQAIPGPAGWPGTLGVRGPWLEIPILRLGLPPALWWQLFTIHPRDDNACGGEGGQCPEI